MGWYGGKASISQLIVDSNLNMTTNYQIRGSYLAVSDTLLDSEDAEVHVTSGYTEYVKYCEVDIPNYLKYGTVRVAVTLKPEYADKTAYIKWMLNDVITIGGEQTVTYAEGYTTKTEDVIVRAGDHIEWWMKTDQNYFYYKEVRVKGTRTNMGEGAWNLATL